MESTLLDILASLRERTTLTPDEVAQIVRSHNAGVKERSRQVSKKKVLRHYFDTKRDDRERWSGWQVTEELESRLLRTLRAKPRRTASGVATITVITKPWPCSNDCVYCPNDLRMPKSYIHNEPACMRAETHYFDPYLQVAGRLRALTHMGHITDKVELIVLGGTWTDYPEPYRIWFVDRLFQALNDAGAPADDPAFSNLAQQRAEALRDTYETAGFSNDEATLAAFVKDEQSLVDARVHTYNDGFRTLYRDDARWSDLATRQQASWDELEAHQQANEDAANRCVGLVIETRPDCLDVTSLTHIRRLGCTKVQMGIQSTDEAILKANGRAITTAQITQAFELLRLFGFKTHTHFMANLLGATPESDTSDYERFVNDPRFCPDEVKLYPCVLLAGTDLVACAERGTWRAYSPEELQDLLARDIVATKPYTRISRMIRDFSAQDIIAGNKTANLRQILEARIGATDARIAEIRHREVAGEPVDPTSLVLEELPYETTATNEVFLQWVTPEDKIAGFLRLSLPKPSSHDPYGTLPVLPNQAMIREVHVYGRVERFHESNEGSQHLGLGRQLVTRACQIAQEAGYASLNVISAVGTRGYYRKLGFADNGLYQTKELASLA